MYTIYNLKPYVVQLMIYNERDEVVRYDLLPVGSEGSSVKVPKLTNQNQTLANRKLIKIVSE